MTTWPEGLRDQRWASSCLQRLGWVAIASVVLFTCASAPVPLVAQASAADASLEHLHAGREVNELPPPGYLAWTECRAGAPISKMDPTLDSITRMELQLHEQVHRLQLAVGCDSIAAVWDNAGREYAQAEAEAWCFAWRGMGYSPGTIARSSEREAWRLAASTRVPTVTRDTILALFRTTCRAQP